MSAGDEINDHWRKLLVIFDQVAELPVALRGSVLDAECGLDEELRAEVESLLAEHDQGAGLLDSPPIAAASAALLRQVEPQGLTLGSLDSQPSSAQADETPAEIGPYRVLELVGAGGMGSVYFAHREQPFHKKVAIKVVKRGMDSEEILRRFEIERQMMATLDHPGICGVFDGGLTADGRPYFVMEFVEGGLPITEFCYQQRLSTEQRIRLFIQLCKAVQHAHGKLVIHRDLKPSNLLVTQDGQPKLVDFGIAKWLDPSFSSNAITRPSVLPMTPAYASPEQIKGLPLSTGSDLYSLGVVLFEILTSTRPWPSREEGGDSAYSRPSSGPPKPSSRARDLLEGRYVADYPRAPLSRPAIPISKDLDSIVQQALCEEPDGRYASVEAFAADLRRWLEHRPVSARPPTFRYLARRFIRRNLRAVSAAVLLLLSLLGGVAATTWQAGVARAERDRARVEMRKSSQVTQLLVDLFKASDPSLQQDAGSLTMREFAEQASTGVLETLGSQPEIEAKMRTALAGIEISLARYDRARALLEASLKKQRSLFPGGHRDLAETLLAMSLLEDFEGRYAEGEAAAREALGMPFDDDLLRAELLLKVGAFELGSNRTEAAETSILRAFELREAGLGSEHPETASALGALAILEFSRGDYSAAVGYLRETVAIKSAALGRSHHSVVHELSNLGSILIAKGDFEEAETINLEVLSLRRDLLGDRHPYVAFSLTHLGTTSKILGRLEKSEKYFAQALEIRRETYGERHRLVAESEAVLADVLSLRGRHEEAEALARRSLESMEVIYGEHHRMVAVPLETLAATLFRRLDGVGAIELLERCLRIRRAELTPDHPETARTLVALAGALTITGDFARARSLFEEALPMFSSPGLKTHPDGALAFQYRGDLARAQAQPREAEQWYLRSLEVLAAGSPKQHWQRQQVLDRLGDLRSPL